MTKWKKIALKALMAVTLTTTSIYIFAPWKYALYYFKALPNSLQAQVTEASENGIDGVLVYVQKGDAPGTTYTSGWHNKAQNIPAHKDALFKIASIAKLYEAVAIAKMVDAKLLSLDNTLADYLPELATRIEHANKITLRTMVNHTSGIPNYSDQEGFDWSKNIPNVLDLVLDKPANFIPGEDYAYSNTNYLLLNAIMSRVLGYPHTEYIRNEVLVPLGLSNTYFSVNDVEPSKIMSGYHVGYETDWKHLEQGFVASAEDVGIFIRALNDGSLFNGNEKAIYDTIYVVHITKTRCSRKVRS